MIDTIIFDMDGTLIDTEKYFRKCWPQALAAFGYEMSDEQALKPGDEVLQIEDAENASELLFVTSKQKIYKAKVSDFECKKSSILGDYIPGKFGVRIEDMLVCHADSVEDITHAPKELIEL